MVFDLSSPFDFRRINETTIEFKTLSDVEYKVSFFNASGYFWQFPEFSHKVKTFQFDVLHNPHPVLPPDPRVGEMISFLILQFFEQETDGVVFFVHEKSDGKDKGRYRKFESWFRRGRNEFLVKRDAEIQVGRTAILISILLRKDNGQFEQIVAGFDQLVMENSENPKTKHLNPMAFLNESQSAACIVQLFC